MLGHIATLYCQKIWVQINCAGIVLARLEPAAVAMYTVRIDASTSDSRRRQVLLQCWQIAMFFDREESSGAVAFNEAGQ